MYFNPITYFFKSFIRVFTRKFFWVLLILLLIIIGWVLYDKGVFAESNYFFDTDYFYESDVTRARELVGETIWNDENYDIFLFRNNINKSNPYENKYVSYVDISQFGDNVHNYLALQRSNNLGSGYYQMNFYYYTDGVVSGLNAKKNTIFLNNTRYLNENITYTQTEDNQSVYGYFLTNTIVNTNTNGIVCYPIRAHFDTYDTNGQLISLSTLKKEPYFVTTETDIQNWDFDFLEISGGDVPYYTAFPGGSLEDQTTYIELNLVYNYVNYEIDISKFITIDEDTSYWTINIPKNYLFNYVNVQNGVDFKFSLFVEQQNPFEQWTIETNTMTFNLTSEQLAEINNDTNKQIQGTIVEQQQQIVESQQQLQNTITDTTIPADTEFDLPTIDVNDSTANFFDTLFTGIYNAFNTNEDTSISFTIFSKTITINSADFRMLNDSRFTILRNLLESSWYFAIGYMILKDIRHIFDKIKTGNIENAVSNDIKADMV